MPRFSFTQFHHDSRCWTQNDRNIVSHTLELTGGDDETGEINRAILIFDPGSELYLSRKGGTVGYITQKPDGGISLVGWLPVADLPEYLGTLECGEPLSIDLVLCDPRADVGYVRRLGLGRYDKIASATIYRSELDDPRGLSNVVRFPI
jgi:hypothetical protein